MRVLFRELIPLFGRKMHNIMLNGAMMISCVLLPFAIIVWPRWPRGSNSILVRWALVVLIGWIVLAVAGQVYAYLWRRELRISGVVPKWDPAFTMGFTAVLGWMFPLLTSLPFIVIRECIDFIQRRQVARHQKNSQAEVAASNVR